MNRTVFVLVAILCLLSVSSITGLIHIAKADGGTITINADGSISPSTAPIYTTDNVTYTLTGNTINESIVAQRDNIVLNGAGYTVMGNGSGNWMSLIDRSNVTIKNTNIENFQYGIYLENSSNNAIGENNITANNYDGIFLYSSSNNSLSWNNITGTGTNINVTGNIILGNSTGIMLESSSNNNNVNGNSVTSNWVGICLGSSSYDSLSGNNITNNHDGMYPASSSNNTIYLNDFLNNTSQVYSYNSTDVWDNESVGNYWSDYLTKYPNATETDGSGVWNTPYVIDTNNTDNYPLMQPWIPYEGGTVYINADGSITPSTAPIFTTDNTTYTLTGNINITSDTDGIVIMRDNIVLDGAGYTLKGSGSHLIGNGITLADRSNVRVQYMTITSFADGIYLVGSSNDMFWANNVTANSNYDVFLNSSSNNVFNGNNITNSDVGIEFDFSSNSFVFQNNFVNNTNQAHTEFSANFWEDEAGVWGNYWGDYLTKYPNAAGEGYFFWNTPYVIDTNNTDQHPLRVQYNYDIPEFPSFLIPPLFFIATLLTVIIYKKKAVKTSQS